MVFIAGYKADMSSWSIFRKNNKDSGKTAKGIAITIPIAKIIFKKVLNDFLIEFKSFCPIKFAETVAADLLIPSQMKAKNTYILTHIPWTIARSFETWLIAT